jgi:hypothetical protein
MGVVVAAAAVDVLVERQPTIGDTDQYRQWSQLAPTIAGVRTHDHQPDEAVVLTVLQVADEVIGVDDRHPALASPMARLL